MYEKEKAGLLDINTIYDHVRKINYDILPYFNNCKLSEITTAKIEDFIKHLRNRPNGNDKTKKISEQTVVGVIRSLNVILNFAVSKELIAINPYNNVTYKPNAKKNKKELNYFRLDDAIYALKCIDKYADIRLKTFMNIIFSLGCRREEVAGLCWKDIDFSTKEVVYNNAITSQVPTRIVGKRVRVKNLKTDNSYRINILSDKCIKCLKDYYNFKTSCGFTINEDDFVFTTWDNNNPADPNKLSEQWRNFKKTYHIANVDLHRIRHTVSNILERNNTPKKDIANMLGNSERVLQEYYTHVDIDELINMRNILDNKLYNQIEYVEFDINLIVKILNSYSFNKFNEEELKKIDLITNEKINNDNFNFITSKLKDYILNDNPKLNYFIEKNNEFLNIKIKTYNLFNNEKNVKLKKMKNISIVNDVFSI